MNALFAGALCGLVTSALGYNVKSVGFWLIMATGVICFYLGMAH